MLSKIHTQGQSRNRSASLPSSRQVPRLTVETGCKSSLKPTVTNTPSRLPRPQQNPRKHQHSASLNIPKSSIPRPTSLSRPTPPSSTKPKTSPVATPTKSIDISPARRFTKGEPEIVVKHLKSLLGPNTCFADTLPLDDLAALHEREAMDLKSRFRGKQCSQSLSVLGIPLRQTSHYASTRAILGGYEHDLPVMVFSCVEELYKLGLSAACPFSHSKHNPERVQELADLFDSPQHDFGRTVSLSNELLGDIYASLIRYLSHLPEPIFAPVEIGGGLRDALWVCCIEPSSNVSKATPSTIRITQLLLRLLPSPNLSLFIYLMAFICQTVAVQTTHKSTNHILVSRITNDADKNQEIVRLGRTFGPWIFGGSGSSLRSDALVDADMDEKAVVMVSWFIRNWGEVIHGFFDDLPPLASSAWKDNARSSSLNVPELEDVLATPRAMNNQPEPMEDLTGPSPSLAELAEAGSPIKFGVVRRQSYGFLTPAGVQDEFDGRAASIIDVECSGPTMKGNDHDKVSAEVSEVDAMMSRSSSTALNDRLLDSSIAEQAHIPSLQLPEVALSSSPTFFAILSHVRPAVPGEPSVCPLDDIGSPELELDERYKRPLVVVNRTPSDESLHSPIDDGSDDEAKHYASADESLYALYDSTSSESDGDDCFDGVSPRTPLRSNKDNIGIHQDIYVAMVSMNSESSGKGLGFECECECEQKCRVHKYVKELERMLKTVTKERDDAVKRASLIAVPGPWEP
ncbi:hypothetical protein VNI00_013331 [Paramarasmius palmivorus]|uniref:Rho-GAP domain-containing protein n=1 Tax=Paramarasmius palmivorus TaxID=297713 RepID=A0AAW0BZC8_9AGAR